MTEANKNQIIQFIQNEANNDNFLNFGLDSTGSVVINALDEYLLAAFEIKKMDLSSAEFQEIFEALKQYIQNNPQQFEMGDLVRNCRKIKHRGQGRNNLEPSAFTAEQFEEIKNLVPGHCRIKGCYNFYSFHNVTHPGPFGQGGHEIVGDICSFHRSYPDYHYDIMEEFGLGENQEIVSQGEEKRAILMSLEKDGESEVKEQMDIINEERGELFFELKEEEAIINQVNQEEPTRKNPEPGYKREEEEKNKSPIVENNKNSNENIEKLSQISLQEAKIKAKEETNNLLERYGVKSAELDTKI
ncbi:4982_t:CDS:2 [Entrophospora sp. SA101]|nr:4982_t:CDS:2 [Entrophospora sp. SA101]